MDDMPEQGKNSLVHKLYKNTMKSRWWNVVVLYMEHKDSAIMAKINTSGETALHVAISIASRNVVERLVHVITGLLNTDLRMIKDNAGNNPLHVAASTGRVGICVLLAKVDKSLGGFANNAGESPLFLAAFHGHKPVFQCLYALCYPRNIGHDKICLPFFRRKDGETVLHCAIRWEYFDLAFEILLLLGNSLVHCMNEQGITPLHLLATKPSVFRSGCHLGWWKNIIYHCTHVDNLQHETAFQGLIDSDDKRMREHSEANGQNSHSFLRNYQDRNDSTDLHPQVPQGMAQFRMKVK